MEAAVESVTTRRVQFVMSQFVAKAVPINYLTLIQSAFFSQKELSRQAWTGWMLEVCFQRRPCLGLHYQLHKKFMFEVPWM